jgi:predicted N-acetyltransferase YhbS/uncharacterized protein YbaA (DUF1428 family)
MTTIAPKGPEGELQISAPDPDNDAPQLIDLICKTFAAGSGYWKGERICRHGYLLNSNYDWHASRVGKLGGEIITHFGIWRFQIRVGRARVWAAGVGSVTTHGHYRKRGFLRQTANVTFNALRDSDYDISLLFGIPNLYEQFGYRRAWTGLNAAIEVERSSAQAMVGRLERCGSGARADLAALYNRENATLTGTAIRPVFPIGNPLVDSDAYLWKKNKRVAGFVFVGRTGSTLEVRSWAGDPEAILTVVTRLAKARGLSTVQFQWIHYRSKLTRFLRRQNSEFKSDYRSSGGPMIRAISLRRFAMRLRPELEDRVKRSHLSTWRGDLLLDDSREAVTVRINQGKIELLPGAPSLNSVSGNEAIAQLMFGTDEPEETVDTGRIQLRGQAKVLVPVLFPNENPALSFWDRF